jgi:hypothetical protein
VKVKNFKGILRYTIARAGGRGQWWLVEFSGKPNQQKRDRVSPVRKIRSKIL